MEKVKKPQRYPRGLKNRLSYLRSSNSFIHFWVICTPYKIINRYIEIVC